MKLSRTSRVLAAIIAIFGLLFTQLALASYTCPVQNAAKAALMTDAGDMSDCASMGMGRDTAQPGLCHSHCQQGSQSADTAQAPLVQPFVAAELTAVVDAPESVAPSRAFELDGVLLQRIAGPPLAIRNCCFRI